MCMHIVADHRPCKPTANISSLMECVCACTNKTVVTLSCLKPSVELINWPNTVSLMTCLSRAGFPIQANGYVINGPSPMVQEHEQDLTNSDVVTSLYACFGGEKHRQILGTIQEFLESSGEFEPVDLSILHDWDGWTIASSEIV